MKRISVLVTGASGFIGKHLVDKLLGEGSQVYALTRKSNSETDFDKRVQTVKGDITKQFYLPDEITTIFHCAGAISQKDLMESVNIQGTHNIVEAALERDCRLVHLSSAGVIGHIREVYIDEKTKCNPQNFYEKTKLEAEKIVKKAIGKGLMAQILRPTIVFGTGREPASDSFLQLVSAMKLGRYKQIGKGSGIYNIVHVNEVVRAMIALDDDTLSNGGTYFVNTPITFKDMFRIVQEETTGQSVEPMGVPYLFALGAVAAFSIVSALAGIKMPLTFSRLQSLTNRRVFMQQHLLDMTTYHQLLSVENYIKLICKQYAETGLLN